MLSQPESKPSDLILKKIEELTNSISELRDLHSSPGTLPAVPCPGCKALINLNDFPEHYAIEYANTHPPVTVEKPVEKIVEKPTPLKPETLPAMFDHILKCDEKGCEWVAQFKTDVAKKSLEKIGFVERGKEEGKSEEYESLI